MALGLYLLPVYVDQPRFSSLFFGLVRILQFECADPFMNAREKKKMLESSSIKCSFFIPLREVL